MKKITVNIEAEELGDIGGMKVYVSEQIQKYTEELNKWTNKYIPDYIVYIPKFISKRIYKMEIQGDTYRLYRFNKKIAEKTFKINIIKQK